MAAGQADQGVGRGHDLDRPPDELADWALFGSRWPQPLEEGTWHL